MPTARVPHRKPRHFTRNYFGHTLFVRMRGGAEIPFHIICVSEITSSRGSLTVVSDAGVESTILVREAEAALNAGELTMRHMPMADRLALLDRLNDKTVATNSTAILHDLDHETVGV